jgi:ribosomal protein S18 acetylase RimI-like enzyme
MGRRSNASGRRMSPRATAYHPHMVELVHEVTDELVESLQRLVPQLSTSPPPDREQIRAIVASNASRLLVARDPAGRIVGTLTLVVFRTPTGVRAWIEDVIVEGDARGQGVGAALTQEALRLARDEGARTVDLTSRPSREAANALYRSAGFTPRETNVYRYVL